MSRSNRSDAKLSTVAVEILLTLADGPAHGYAVKQAIEDRIGDGYLLGSGSLYQALQRLERRGFVGEDTEAPETDDERRGRVYRIEPAGRQALTAEVARMRRVVSHADRADLTGQEA
jgi:PadR family transcriptional regulator PadR